MWGGGEEQCSLTNLVAELWQSRVECQSLETRGDHLRLEMWVIRLNPLVSLMV